uniref:inorganic diphosphatase n=1 Tax=Salix viminalis TaxID=40686 RepID=A0A6N2MGD0_SALVM
MKLFWGSGFEFEIRSDGYTEGDGLKGRKNEYAVMDSGFLQQLQYKLELRVASTKLGDPLFAFNEIDAVEICQILEVKPSVALAVINEGEINWKIVAISFDDPNASLVYDVEKHLPAILVFSPRLCIF